MNKDKLIRIAQRAVKAAGYDCQVLDAFHSHEDGKWRLIFTNHYGECVVDPRAESFTDGENEADVIEYLRYAHQTINPDANYEAAPERTGYALKDGLSPATWRETFADSNHWAHPTFRAVWIALVKAAFPAQPLNDGASWEVILEAIQSARPEWKITLDTGFNETINLIRQELKRAREAGIRQDSKKRPKRALSLPRVIPQQTWPEARNMAIALADGPSGRGWQDIVGEISLRHVREDDPIQIKLVAGPSIDWWGMPATHEKLRDELREAGVDAALLLNEVLYLALMCPGQMLPLDSLIQSIGWDPRSTAEKNEYRKWVWRKISLFENMLAVGQRRGMYPHPDTKKKVPVAIVDRLVILGPRLMPEQKAFDNSEPPFEVSFKPGEHLEQYKGNRKVLTDYGDVRRIAEIPAKQASGKWARSVGLTLNQLWRQESKKGQITHSTFGDKGNELSVKFRAFTRRELLTKYFMAVPNVEDLLNGEHPKRARQCWDGAIKHLKLKGVIKGCKPLTPARESDKNAWLDQPLDIRPGASAIQDTIEIVKAQKRITRAPRKSANRT